MSVASSRADAVTFAYIHSNECTHSWHHSVIELIAYDMANQARVGRGGWIAIHCGTGNLGEARNEAVTTFLKEDNADWLFWSDTDMGFEPDMIDRLLAVADPDERPIVGALCFSQRELESDGHGGFITYATPTIFDWAGEKEKRGYSVRWNYPENALVRCSATGSAAIIIHRSAFEKIEKAHGKVWYDRVRNTTTGQPLGEDLSFCLRATSLEMAVHVLTSIEATHAKLDFISSRQYKYQRAGQAAQNRIVNAQAAAVIVPVLGRPQNAEPFMASLKASTDRATVYAIVGPDKDAGKTALAWKKAGAQIRVCQGNSFAEKINHGYRITTEPWLLLAGDDVRFHLGWLEAAQAVGADVTGTNDLGNPRVLAGHHSCHPLIRRSYIGTVGASWDGPGIVAHEGYGHWFVDDEIVTAAKQRGVWGMALDSIVEHLHPLWGKGVMDEIYELGTSKAEADRAHFEERLQAQSNPKVAVG